MQFNATFGVVFKVHLLKKFQILLKKFDKFHRMDKYGVLVLEKEKVRAEAYISSHIFRTGYPRSPSA